MYNYHGKSIALQKNRSRPPPRHTDESGLGIQDQVEANKPVLLHDFVVAKVSVHCRRFRLKYF